MEEDLKILEDFCEDYHRLERTHVDYLFSMKEKDIPITAIENLIAENKRKEGVKVEEDINTCRYNKIYSCNHSLGLCETCYIYKNMAKNLNLKTEQDKKEEDIKILEHKLRLNAETRFDWFGEKEFQAIENLIAENKELKEKVKILSNHNYYIEKSKIEEEFERMIVHSNCFNVGDMNDLLDRILN